MTDRPALPPRVHRHGATIGPDGRPVGKPAAHRQAEPKRRQAVQSASEPLSLAIDLGAHAAAIQAAADPVATLRALVVSIVEGVSAKVHQRSVVAGAVAALRSSEVQKLADTAFAAGLKAGRRSLTLDETSASALGAALGASLAKQQQQVVVNVPQQAPPTVTVEVPARTIVARTNGDGSVTMTPE